MKALQQLLNSKKGFVALLAILAVVVVVLAAADMERIEAAFDVLKWIVGTFLVGQGIADHGKGKAEIEKKVDGAAKNSVYSSK